MDLCLDEDEIYQMQCGEMFFTTKGRLIFHCTLCEKKFDGFALYEMHIKEHIPTFNDDDDDDQTKDDLSFLEYVEQDINEDIHEISKNQSCEELSEIAKDLLDESLESEKNVKSNIEMSKPCYSSENENNGDIEDMKEEDLEQKLLIRAENGCCEISEVVRNVRTAVFPKSLLIPDEERKYKCPVCNAGFKEKHNMHHHLKRHTNKKDYKCPECDKAFFFLYEVRIHMKSHSKDRPFLCNICGNSYAHNGKLLAHIRQHSGQKNFSCDKCNKSFFDKLGLKRHMVSHSSLRPFNCETCGADFSHLKSLQNHLKLHENKREFKCDICGHRFNQRAGLSSHLKSAHKTNLKQCSNSINA